jgi:hypothetical protein
MNCCEQAIEILQQTNDGDDLSPEDLYMVECAVNGILTFEGLEVFANLHQACLHGYKKPWYFGIEHLTVNHLHDVQWRGKTVENFTRLRTKEAHSQAIEIARRCRILEERGVEPNVKSVVWNWGEAKCSESTEL